MDKFRQDISYNLDYLVIVPSKDASLVNDFRFTFENVILFDNTIQDTEFLIKFLRKNIVGQLIFVDYYAEYEEIINTLVEEHEIKFIFTKSLGELSAPTTLFEFNTICDKYDKKAICEIGFLDWNLYDTMRAKRRNVKHVVIDTPVVKSKHSPEKTIGLLNSGDSNYDSFYNELSAISFLPEYKAKTLNATDLVRQFADEFDVKLSESDSFDELVDGNICNLYINFAGTLPDVFIKSMDRGVPCIIGNNDFIKNYPVLQKFLVMQSDDDIDEIHNKLILARSNARLIFKEYRLFRKEYTKLANKSSKEFLGQDVDRKKQKEYDKLLTVIVPVYNTEKYLARCIDSVIAAQIPSMEILVINDGSTDNSKKIIDRYIAQHPDLIRCIDKKNGGLGSVRNIGLKEAKGKYLASVDSDDTIEPEFFQQALKYMKSDIDAVVCDWTSISDKESFETVALDWIFKKRKEFVGIMYTTIMPSTCNKIIKREIFQKNNVKYMEQKYEDLSANPLVLLKAKTIKYLSKPYYNYYLSENSLMRSKVDPRQMVDVLAFLNLKMSRTRTHLDIKELKYYTYSWRIEEYVINPLYELEDEELFGAIKYINKHLYNIMIEVFDSTYYKKMLSGIGSKEKREFIRNRNAAIKAKKLGEFLKNNAGTPQMLNAGTIYYGE